jgi:hypothetical protein
MVLGASAGISVEGYVTNATTSADLMGKFTAISLNLPIGSMQFATDGRIWMFSAGPAIVGTGLSVSAYETNTVPLGWRGGGC